ncbi:MAG: pentapeptide repeat-containing protein [Acidimicrobiales bacterium]|nr:pentapeptide repeat-containing protein [Acidimicrobiales bacterium]
MSVIAVLATPAGALGTVHGTVTDAGAAPVAGVEVRAYDAVYGTLRATAVTAADGTYSQPVLAGSYRLQFHDPSGTYADEFFDDASDWASSGVAVVPESGDLLADASLAPAHGSVAGTVTAAGSGTPLQGITVEVLNAFGWVVASAVTASDGTFAIVGVPAGTVTVRYHDPSGTYATRYYDGADTSGAATLVAVTGGATATADQALAPGGALSGTVRMGTLPAPGILVGAFSVGDLALAGLAATASDGSWTIAGQADGDYLVLYLDPAILGPNPEHALRPVVAPDIDVLSVGLVPAVEAATPYPVSGGATTNLGSASMVGDDCPPGGFVEWSYHTNTDFSGADLRGCRMVRVRFGGSDFGGADLSGADLTASNLTGVDAAGAVLDGAIITSSNWTGAVGVTAEQLTVTSPNWTSLALPSVDLSGVDFSERGYTMAYLWAPGAQLAGADLTGVQLGGANLIGADLQGTTMVATPMAAANVSGAHISGATIVKMPSPYPPYLAGGLSSGQLLSVDHDWSDAQLSLPGVKLDGVNFAGGGYDLHGVALGAMSVRLANFAGMDLTGASFPATNGQDANFAGADLTGAAFAGTAAVSGTSFTSADFSGANLTGASLAASWFNDSDFTGADLSGANLAGARLCGADGLTVPQVLAASHDWTNTCLSSTGLDLSGIDFVAGGFTLTKANLTDLNMQGAVFTGLDLTQTVIAGADLSDAVGLTGAQVKAAGGDWQGTDLSGNNLYLGGIDFSVTGRWLAGANLSGANLWLSTFNARDMTGTNLTGTILFNTRFLNTKLAGAQLGGADVRFARFDGATGLPSGGTSATYGTTTCPDLTMASAPATCVGHGFGA